MDLSKLLKLLTYAIAPQNSPREVELNWDYKPKENREEVNDYIHKNFDNILKLSKKNKKELKKLIEKLSKKISNSI